MTKIDKELIADIDYINRSGARTMASCSGHGVFHQTIFYRYNGEYFEWFSGIKVFPIKRKHLCFYRKDKKTKLYYNPEVEEYWRDKE